MRLSIVGKSPGLSIVGSPETLYSGDSGRGTGRWNAEDNSEDLSLGAGKDNSRRTDIRLPVVRRKTSCLMGN